MSDSQNTVSQRVPFSLVGRVLLGVLAVVSVLLAIWVRSGAITGRTEPLALSVFTLVPGVIAAYLALRGTYRRWPEHVVEILAMLGPTWVFAFSFVGIRPSAAQLYIAAAVNIAVFACLHMLARWHAPWWCGLLVVLCVLVGGPAVVYRLYPLPRGLQALGQAVFLTVYPALIINEALRLLRREPTEGEAAVS